MLIIYVETKNKNMNATPENQTEWGYTQSAKGIDEIRRLLNDKRHLIERDGSVLNGIYSGGYGGEAIVVDYDREHEYYDRIVDSALDRALKPDGTPDKGRILDSVFEVASETMAYSLDGADKVNDELGVKDYQKVSLAAYAEAGIGVCRHQALLVTTMLEILHNRGIISGTASIDRNIQWPEEGDPGGHAWVRYTNSAGQVYILDVAQKFIGTLDESQSRESGWNYLRPQEIEEKRRKSLGLVATSTTGIIDGIPEHLR